MSLLGRLIERRAVTYGDPYAIPRNSDGYTADSGEYVSDRTALQLVTVYACVRLLADSVAAMPLDAYRKQGNVRTEVEPSPSLIREPFSGLTPFEGWFQVMTSLAMRGNSYSLVMSRDSLEYPTSLMPLHPDRVRVEQDRETGKPLYRVEGDRVPASDMVHIRRFALPGAVIGVSPIEQARQGIGLGLAAERYGARWFGDSANPSAVLETDADLSDDQVTRTQKQWVSSHGGRRHPAVLSGGFRYRQIAITPNESQFLETRKFQSSEIAKLFGVPPHMVGDTEKATSWGTGIEQQSIGFVTYTLRPWLSCIEAAVSTLLPRGQFARFNVDALLRGDSKSRYEAYTQARNAGWLNVDEIRELEDRPPIPDGTGQSYVQPLNFGPLGSDPLAARERSQEEPENA